MKTLVTCMAAALAISTGTHAADANRALVTIEYTDTVAPAEMQAYEAGIKAYVKCLREHRVTFNEYAVSHATGQDTYQVSFEREPMTWAKRDELGGEYRPCKPIFNTQVDPHLYSESAAVLMEQPTMSHVAFSAMHQVPPQVLHVFNYTLKSGPAAQAAFAAAMKKIATAAAKTKWPYYWDMVAIEGGGEGAPDYQLVIGSKDWAEAGAEPDLSLWKMVAKAYGQSEADAIRESLDGAIERISDHFDRYSAELSYIAGK